MSGLNSSNLAGGGRADEPLTLTVHSLPRPEGAAEAERARGRWKMLLLLLVAASPVIASYFTYYVIRPQGRANYGELIDPQRPLPEWEGVGPDGRAVPLASLRHQWLLVSVADTACDQRCRDHLYLQRQLREGLGKDKDRLDWVWLRTGSGEVPAELRAALATARVLHVDEARLSEWLAPAPGQALADHLYVVDPPGNWMMRFPAQADPKKVRRDLNRLLRASAFWDRPGRPDEAS
jgi:hypothetical protein